LFNEVYYVIHKILSLLGRLEIFIERIQTEACADGENLHPMLSPGKRSDQIISLRRITGIDRD
jgi:hypothetical protein